MNVSLSPKLEKFVQTKLRKGSYNSASEVVREALRLLEEYDKVRAAQLLAFDQELENRLASLDRGEVVDGREVRARLRRRTQQRRRSA